MGLNDRIRRDQMNSQAYDDVLYGYGPMFPHNTLYMEYYDFWKRIIIEIKKCGGIILV